MFFIELLILSVPLICHNTWVNLSKSENTKNDKVSNTIFGIAIIIIVSLSAFYIIENGFTGFVGRDTSYYIDYNNNGQMDKGEHVYDEFDDGTEGYDYDGDGWND